MDARVWAVVCLCAVWCAGAERGSGGAGGGGGASLRGALEALQRRQRSRHGPPPQDYDAVYDLIPPQPYAEPDYPIEIEDFDDEPSSKYIVKLLEENARRPESYEYKLIKKKNSRLNLLNPGSKKESAFRERSHQADRGSLRELFMDKNEAEEQKSLNEKAENDAEYALLLGQLWSKYKSDKAHENDAIDSQGIVKLYKDKIVKKRYPDNWGPIAFKKKRSSGPDLEHSNLESDKNVRNLQSASNYNGYELADNDKDDLREEYAIAFQPLDDDSLTDPTADDQYFYDSTEKRFPVSKRSGVSYAKNAPNKRFIHDQDKSDSIKQFRSSSGTDPKVLKDLAQIFGDSDIEIRNPVKRSSDHEDHDHDIKPPRVLEAHNHTHEHNSTFYVDTDHEDHSHLHHPGTTGKESDHVHDHDHTHHDHAHKLNEKPKIIRKKSIDWSDYFGIDKRKKKSVEYVREPGQERYRKQYFDTFNKEVIYPLNSFRKHSYVKRNYDPNKSNEDTDMEKYRVGADEEVNDDNKRSESDSKLDSIDKKLRNMEGLIVDEALHYTDAGEELDSKEEQEMKEKLLSRLAAAYSLEKMRKALKDFKQSLQINRNNAKTSAPPLEEAKIKRVALKKEKVEIENNEIPPLRKDPIGDDFEDEVGAGHYLNGEVDQEFSEGYMGGSGRHHSPVVSTVGAPGSCPVLAKIVQRCRGVDLLAGDRGQLFLPLCSLHQICYLCGEAPPTTCDLVFLSEADTACEGDMACQRAARSALMALRELHDSQADELDGECEASPCLPATLKMNISWQRAIQR